MQFEDLLSFLSEADSANLTLRRSGPVCKAKLAASLLAAGRSSIVLARDAQEKQELKALLQLFAPVSHSQQASGLNGAGANAFDSDIFGPDSPKAVWEQPFVNLPSLKAEYKNEAQSRQEAAELVAALYALQRNPGPKIVLASLGAFLPQLPPENFLHERTLSLRCGTELSPDYLVEKAVEWGYTRAPMLGQPGEVAVRGDIFDIFAPGYSHPLRIEFFGDNIEQIRLFDLNTQRSKGNLDEALLLPARPVLPELECLKAALSYWAKLLAKGHISENAEYTLRSSVERNVFSRLPLPGLFYEHSSALSKLLPGGAILLLPPQDEVKGLLQAERRAWLEALQQQELKRAGETGAGAQDEFESALQVEFGAESPEAETSEAEEPEGKKSTPKGKIKPPLDPEQAEESLALASILLAPEQDVDFYLSAQSKVHFEEVPFGLGKPEGLSTPDDEESLTFVERRIHSFEELFPLPSDRERPWHRLLEKLAQWRQNGTTVLLSFPTARSRVKFLNLAAQDEVYPTLQLPTDFLPGPKATNTKQSAKQTSALSEGGLYALLSPFREGAELPFANLLVLGEDVMQPLKQATRAKSRVFSGLDKYDDLKPGDFLVHRDFGIGRFEGLHRLKLGDVEADFLLLLYADDDKFYLPVDRLSLVQRFKGPDGLLPPLDKLGGSLWQSSKGKIKKAIEQIAHDLVEMYAYRKLAKGYSYGQVNELFNEFEASFGFEETPDQAAAINDVLEDMDKLEAMDRLVCGDVGFGKTEVALRAAFRAAAAGKQVVLLCPTTILAEQHYKTFVSRLAGFGLNVGMLSRFVPRKQQEEVLAQAARGLVDVLIGTHRLLSGDVHLPNLSLLILDEEQRFGVRHKEKLKQLRQNIDVLTLTATPIPRTLQLSIAGLRGLSLIETAPPERKPVISTVVQRDDDLLRQVLARELARQGQVFWVHNRVQSIESVAEYVRALAPGARVGVAHGQMSERHLEDAMHKFWQGDVDILVCTAIIESGIDFPRANTLVVDGAQMFGLGQLYQLRGRVGRSDLQAYAVFVAPPEIKNSPKQFGAFRERLQVILNMDYLGAGFQVAMEDLRIRGAGNILGEAQSGHMARVGLDLYLEMLEDAVTRLKDGKSLEVRETELSIAIPALIPASYMQDANLRLKYYKALSSAPEASALQDVELEIRDLFGPLPEELVNFIAVLVLKRFLGTLQVARADIFSDKVKLAWSAGSEAIDPAAFVAWVGKQAGRARVLPPNALEYTLDASLSLPQRLLAVCDDLQGLACVDI